MNTHYKNGPKRVFVAGATGYIGRHVVKALVKRGHEVVSFVRQQVGPHGQYLSDRSQHLLKGSEIRVGNICRLQSIKEQGFCGDHFDAVISCVASRTGGIEDARRVDYEANHLLLQACQSAGVNQFILLSAICLQKPELAFQFAKLKFEDELMRAGINYSIVRPTAYFKSLAGQVENVKKGKPFIVFGDGRLTACKPIGEEDLASFIVDCIDDTTRHRQILPVGGPGPAITPLQQGQLLFDLCQRKPRYRHVPAQLFDLIIALLTPAAWFIPAVRDRIEFARIGRYYATESMLVLNPRTDQYDEAATPSYGEQTLRDFYARVIKEGNAGQELGDHAMFS